MSAFQASLAPESMVERRFGVSRRTMFVASWLLALPWAMATQAATFTVTNTADAGAGSFRQAILDANAMQGPGGTSCPAQTIVFNIPGAGTHTIQPLSALPRFNIPITVNGYSQPGSSTNTLFEGSNAIMGVELDGSLAGASDGLVIGAGIPGSGLCSGSSSAIRGLVINRFAGAAISMGEESCPIDASCPVGGVIIQGNFFGTDVSGNLPFGNGFGMSRPTIVFGRGSSNNVLGDQIAVDGGPNDPSPPTRNVIAAGAADGIYIGSPRPDSPSVSHSIRNNIIGLNGLGTVALGNGGRGVTVDTNSVAISIHDNLISANVGDGIGMFDNSPGSTLLANGIGIGAGAVPFGNGGNGIVIGGNTRGITLSRRFLFSPFGATSIANNLGAGVLVEGLAQLDLVDASLGGNAGLALDLAPIGVTPNDPGDTDGGPNELLNKPTIVSAIRDSITLRTTISGSLSAAPNSSYEIHFYVSDQCDASGYGGGTQLVQLSPPPIIASVTTDAAGSASFVRQTVGLTPGKVLTAISRRFSSGPPPQVLIVSEFSACRPIIPDTDLIFANGFDP